MENSPLLSVIVPVYGVERYLDRCLDSIVGQTYLNLEIILVDDKSPDKCPAMCDSWAERDHRIKVIHKPVNEGLGYARNTGMEHMTGDYFTFVDSDDYLDVDIYRKMMDEIVRKEVDIAFMGSFKELPDGSMAENKLTVETEFYGDNMVDFAYNFIPGVCDKTYLCSVCMAIFKRVGNLPKFDSERSAVSEDLRWMLRIIFNVSKVCRLPYSGYYYMFNPASISNTYRTADIPKIIKSAELIELIFDGSTENPAGTYLFHRMLSYIRNDLYGRNLKPSDRREAIRLIIKDDSYQRMLKKYRVRARGMNERIFACVQRTGNITLNLIYGWIDRNVVINKFGLKRK